MPQLVVFMVCCAGAFVLIVSAPWLLSGLLGVGLAVTALAVWATHRRPVEVGPPEPPPNGMDTGLYLGDWIRSGHPYAPVLAGQHAVIGGVPDSGKSNTINALLAAVAWLPDVQILGVDPKGGLELWPWRARLTALATRPDEWAGLLRALKVEVERRQEFLRDRGVRNLLAWNRDTRRRLGLPWIMLIIDETNEVLNLDPDPDRRREVEADLMSLISTARAVGVSVVLATQKPAADSIPTGIRDLARMRVAHTTTTPEMTDTILGRTATTRGATAHRIEAPGVACVWNTAEARFGWVRMRYVTDAEVRVTADVTGHIAVPWNLRPFMPAPRKRRARARRKRRARARRPLPAPAARVADQEATVALEEEVTG